MAYHIDISEHVFIAGRTGTGKTQLDRVYLCNMPNVYVMDTKRTLKWHEIPGTIWEADEIGTDGKVTRYNFGLIDGKDKLAVAETIDQFFSMVKTFPKVIYRPSLDEWGNQDIYNRFYRYCFERGNCIAWTDELTAVCPNPAVIPPFLKHIYTQGRELLVSSWGNTQRPSGIPQITISEATHFFVFDLNLEADRKKLVDITGVQEFMTRPKGHKFWYTNIYRDDAVMLELTLKNKGVK